MGSGGVVCRRAGVSPVERLNGGEAARGDGEQLVTTGIPKPDGGPANSNVIDAARIISAAPHAEAMRPRRPMTPSNWKMNQSPEDWWRVFLLSIAATVMAKNDTGANLSCARCHDAATPMSPAREGAARFAMEASEAAGAAAGSVTPRTKLGAGRGRSPLRSRTTKLRGGRVGPTNGIRNASTSPWGEAR